MASPHPSRRIIVWIVALASMAEAFLQALDYAWDQGWGKARRWSLGAVVIFGLAWIGERVKLEGDE